MCGRFFLARRALEISRALGIGLSPGAAAWRPRYNIAPTQDILVAAPGPEGDRLDVRRWGLIPVWAKDPSIGNRMINARLETVASKPAHARPFRSGRCVILADGFYELKKEGKGKTPYALRAPREEDILGFAGLQGRWTSPRGEEIRSCTIITRPAEGAASKVHERMPAILPRESWEAWLAPDADPKALLRLLESLVAPRLEAVALSKAVNNPGNDSPEVLKPA